MSALLLARRVECVATAAGGGDTVSRLREW